MSSILSSLSVAQLKRAATIKEQIEQLEMDLTSILGATPAIVPDFAPKKRTMSAAAKAKISAAQKARWAKERGEEPSKVATTSAAKPKRILSAAARAKLSAGAKARWAKAKAAKD
jgi:hypothetical protein